VFRRNGLGRCALLARVFCPLEATLLVIKGRSLHSELSRRHHEHLPPAQRPGISALEAVQMSWRDGRGRTVDAEIVGESTAGIPRDVRSSRGYRLL
jgi:hypothetical protein